MPAIFNRKELQMKRIYTVCLMMMIGILLTACKGKQETVKQAEGEKTQEIVVTQMPESEKAIVPDFSPAPIVSETEKEEKTSPPAIVVETEAPTEAPKVEPEEDVIIIPTEKPTEPPLEMPTEEPRPVPTAAPVMTASPTEVPTEKPVELPFVPAN